MMVAVYRLHRSPPSLIFLAGLGSLVLAGAIVSIVGLASDPQEDAAEAVYAGGLALAGLAAALTASLVYERQQALAEARLRATRFISAVERLLSGLDASEAAALRAKRAFGDAERAQKEREEAAEGWQTKQDAETAARARDEAD